MTKEQAGSIRKWETRLEAVPLLKNEQTSPTQMIFHLKPTWVVTDFARNLKEEFLYVIQPLENPSEMGEGVTGMTAYCLTEPELLMYFQIK
jgi:hypothetical protein